LLLFTIENTAVILTSLTRFFASRQCPAFLVGGYLRDSLLSLPSQDIDVAVAGNPQLLGQELAQELGGAFIPLSPTHGVARVVVRGPDNQPCTVDVTGLSGNIEEDLARRDFTINALALPLENWLSDYWREAILDPFNGREDLSRKRIRTVSPYVFQDDPGRLLRAVRLAARLQFRLDPETARLIRTEAHRIERVSGERVRDELLAILAQDNARTQLEVLDRLDLLCRIIPELALAKGVEQPRVHYWDVWGHLLHTVEAAERVTGGHQNSAIYSFVPWTPKAEEYFSQEVSDGHTRRTILKLAGLLHDIAKPQTKSQDETGRTRFFGHSELGAEMADTRLAQLRLSSKGIAMVTKMVEQHLRPTNMQHGAELPTKRAIYRYFRDLGDVAIDTLYLAMADYLAAKGPQLSPDDWGNHARMMTYILQTGAEQAKPGKPERLVTGHDLMQRFNLSPGPEIGLLLDKINEARAAGEISTQEEALALAAEAINHLS
jgi:poly(A) polymerase